LQLVPVARGNAKEDDRSKLRAAAVDGYALYSLNRWEQAMQQYREVVKHDPGAIAALARVVDCQSALGQAGEAAKTAVEVAKLHLERGDLLLLGKKPDKATLDYERSLRIYARLSEDRADVMFTNGLGRSFAARGNAFFMRRSMDPAVADFTQAIALLTNVGQEVNAGTLAKLYNNRANGFLLQGKADAALADFDKAIVLLNLSSGRPSGPQSATELARAHNNRGVVLRASGKQLEALSSFQKAVDTVSGSASDQKSHSPEAGKEDPLELDVTMAFSEKIIDPIIRAQRASRSERVEERVVLAAALKNRGYSEWITGRTREALADFEKATGIDARLVNEDREADLGQEYARSLSALAWVYATDADAAVRSEKKAKDYALKACELSDWKSLAPLETLAAALAELGDFENASKWEEKAVEVAPERYKAEVRSRMELYKSGKPYRMSFRKAE